MTCDEQVAASTSTRLARQAACRTLARSSPTSPGTSSSTTPSAPATSTSTPPQPAWSEASDATVAHTLVPDGALPPGLPTAADLGCRRAGRPRSTSRSCPACRSTPTATASRDSPLKAARRLRQRLPTACAASTSCRPTPTSARCSPRGATTSAAGSRSSTTSTSVHGRGTAPATPRWAKRILEPTVALGAAARRRRPRAPGLGQRPHRLHLRPPSRRQSAYAAHRAARHAPAPAPGRGGRGHLRQRRRCAAGPRARRGRRRPPGARGVAAASVTVYSCDAAVHTVQRVRRASDAKLAEPAGPTCASGSEPEAAAPAARPRRRLHRRRDPWPEHRHPAAPSSPRCSAAAARTSRRRRRGPPGWSACWLRIQPFHLAQVWIPADRARLLRMGRDGDQVRHVVPVAAGDRAPGRSRSSHRVVPPGSTRTSVTRPGRCSRSSTRCPGSR